jgi:hypothetical protein
VVHQQGVGTFGDGGLDQGQARRHPGDQLADLSLSLDLQTVRPIILESICLQQLIEVGKQGISVVHGGPFVISFTCARPG